MSKKIFAGVGLFLVMFFCRISLASHVSFEGQYWFPSLNGKVNITAGGISGTEINMKNDLGMRDENVPEGKFTWTINPKNKITLSYLWVEYNGNATITKSINYNGQTYAIGNHIISQLDLNDINIGWTRYFGNVKNAKFKVGLLLEARGFQLKGNLNDTTLALSTSKTISGVLPTVGLVFSVNPNKKINIFVRASGITAGKYGYFLDAQGGIKWLLLKNFYISAGYRTLDIEGKSDPDYAKIQLSGPFVVAGLKF
ncbi:MAG: hypothetical protein M1501_00765 [Candidatus Omnitrophica bacterium]|nr:hypothetical protein [Candidatus Omnitrophota bacterium]